MKKITATPFLTLLLFYGSQARADLIYQCGVTDLVTGYDTIVHVTIAETSLDALFELYVEAFYTIQKSTGSESYYQYAPRRLDWLNGTFPDGIGVYLPADTIAPDLSALVSTTGDGGNLFYVIAWPVQNPVASCPTFVELISIPIA